MACMVEYTPSVYTIALTRDGLYLDKEAEMACETPLEGDKVRVHTYVTTPSKIDHLAAKLEIRIKSLLKSSYLSV